MKRKSHHKQQQQHQLSLESLVQQVQQMKGLDKDDVIDDKAGLYKFTVSITIVLALCVMQLLLIVFSQQQRTVSDPLYIEGSISAAINQHLTSCTVSNDHHDFLNLHEYS